MSHHYRLRPVSTTQREQWDSFIAGHPQGHVLQSWGWGELKALGGWNPLRLALWDTEQQTIVAAAQVLRRSAGRLPLWIGHLAYIPKGPVLDWSNSALCQEFFSYLHPFLYRQGALALHMELGQHNVGVPATNIPPLADTLTTLHFHPVPSVQPLRTILLDLTPDEATLLARMKEKWRYNVRLAGRKGVTVRVAQTIEDVHAWYDLLQTTGERDSFGVHTRDYYLSAWRIFAPRNQARLFLAEYQGQLLAGIFVSKCAQQGIYLYGASSNEQRNLMPNHLLQWEAMRWAKQEGAVSYDFWGIPETDDEEEAMAGVYRFKRGWGGEVVQFVGCYEHIYRPLRLSLAKRMLDRQGNQR